MTSVPKNVDEQITISIYIKRDLHENGMTLKEYADAVIAGDHKVLDHDSFVYQFGATEEDLKVVTTWAEENNLTVVLSDAGMATVKVQGSVASFNKLFDITLIDVDDASNDRTYMSHTGTVTIPAEISAVVENVLGFDQSFIAVRHAIKQVDIDAVPDVTNPNIYVGAVTPPAVASAYKLPPGDGLGGVIGIFELTYSGYVTGWNQNDVNGSFSRIGLQSPTITNVGIDGASVSTTSDPETMMDIYCAGGVAPKAKIVVYDAPNGGTMYINDIINYAANDNVNKPEVLSISWGIGDGTAFDSAMQSCAVKGITVIVSSGDSGTTGAQIDWSSCTSPYCISAGGTNIGISNGNKLGESAWSGSGGGISYVQPKPSWQNGLTSQTKSNTGTLGIPTALSNRGIPDISAPADPYSGYQFYVNNSLVQYGGTSAAAPFLAGAIVRMNRLLGKRIGLPMAVFYSNQSAFNDIITGDNVDGHTMGYNTTTGWDAVTGLGTINGPLFYSLFRTGAVYPKQSYSFRPSVGPLYPRNSTYPNK